MTVSFCLDGNIDKDFGPHFNCASKSSPLGMQQWEHTLLLCVTNWCLCCACILWKGHCDWHIHGIFNDKNKGKIQIIVDKVERTKTKKLELADSISLSVHLPPHPSQFSFLYSLYCVFTLLDLYFSHSLKYPSLSIFCTKVSGKVFPRPIACSATLLSMPWTKTSISVCIMTSSLMVG